MKVFLFLYPTTEYFESCWRFPVGQKERARELLGYFNRVVEARYRQRGYAVYWLCFSSIGDSSRSDKNGVYSPVEVAERDTIISAGVDFRTHCAEKRYADPSYVFAQLPSSLEELWIGGFHYWDCVCKMGRYAYYVAGLKGKVKVDEDLNERFFSRLAVEGQPGCSDPLKGLPLVRMHTYESLGYTALEDWKTSWIWSRMRRIRNLNPWFTHR